MKIYIFADMEGISGISGSDYVLPDRPRFAEGRKYYTQEINVCVSACYDAGAEAVIVRDGHAAGNYVHWDQFDSRAELVQGQSGGRRFPGIDECQGLILLGYHAMAGTPGALLEHTYSSTSVQNYWLNGRAVGEIGIDASIASEHGVPTILVTGDDHACREAASWIPGVVTCPVKSGLHCQGTRLLSMAEAHRRIREKVAEAIHRLPQIKPIEVTQPVVLRKEMVERVGIPGDARPDIRVLDARTFEIIAESVEKAIFAS